MKISKTWIRLCNLLCAVLMIALLVFQFMPFWTMPSCSCDHSCEVEANEDCEACAVAVEWCAIPSACTCKYTCRGKNVDTACPVCSRDSEKCVSKEAAPKQETPAEQETTGAADVADTEEPAEQETTAADTTAVTDTTETPETPETPETVETPEEPEVSEEPEAEPVEVPFPTFGENEVDRTPLVVSIQEYVWTPTFDNCVGVNDYFDGIFTDDKGTISKKDDDEFMVKDIVLMPILVLFGTLFGAFFCLTKSGKALNTVFPLIVGIAGIVGYLTLPIFQMGALWQVHLALSIAITVLALPNAAECIFRAIDWCNPNKAQ